MEQLIETKLGWLELQQWQMIEDRLRKLEEKPAAIEESQERIEFKVDQLKFNDPVAKVVQGAQEGALQQDKAEEIEIEHRKQNVIVHGVPESNEDSPEQRIEEDTTVLAAMFHEIGADDVKLESVVRLGKRSDDPAHPRPMKIVLDSVEGKVKLLRNTKNLRLKRREVGRRCLFTKT